MAQIEKEEAQRQRVVESVVAPPSRRVNFTLSAHPFKDELIMFGGEFYDGQKVYKSPWKDFVYIIPRNRFHSH